MPLQLDVILITAVLVLSWVTFVAFITHGLSIETIYQAVGIITHYIEGRSM